MAKVSDVTRSIKREVERELWGRAAAHCQFSDCNRLLYKSNVTQETVNIAEMAHIYSFSPDGPRGRGPFTSDTSGLNDVANLMLVCYDCHKLIDDDKEGKRYSADLLKQWKNEHESRVRIATGIPATKRSHVVLYGSRIGDENSPLRLGLAYDAMFPDWYPADDRAINLSMQSALDDGTPEFWAAEAQHLRKEFNKHIRPRVEEAQPNQFSIFALASQPLLIQLGALFTDKVPAIVYQPVREPKTGAVNHILTGSVSSSTNQTINLARRSFSSHSATRSITTASIRRSAAKASIWEVTSNDCHNDFLRSEAQLSEFRATVRKLFVRLREAHPTAKEVLIFPVMPVACAIELGRVRMPKADLPWQVYDHHNKQNAFVKRLTIGLFDE